MESYNPRKGKSFMNKVAILILLLPMFLLVSCATGSKSMMIQKAKTPLPKVDPALWRELLKN